MGLGSFEVSSSPSLPSLFLHMVVLLWSSIVISCVTATIASRFPLTTGPPVVRYQGFVACILVGAGFYALAFFVGLPVIVFRPAKFALSATLGSIFTMVRPPIECYGRC
jgi:hypothetical protein